MEECGGGGGGGGGSGGGGGGGGGGGVCVCACVVVVTCGEACILKGGKLFGESVYHHTGGLVLTSGGRSGLALTPGRVGVGGSANIALTCCLSAACAFEARMKDTQSAR